METSQAAQLHQARCLADAGQRTQALAHYRALLASSPGSADLWYEIGWLLRSDGQWEAALDAYAQALARGVRDPQEVHLNRAVILTDDLHQHTAAERELRSALAIDPQYLPAQLNLGKLHEDQANHAAAVESYRSILEAPAIRPAHAPLQLEALARLVELDSPTSPSDPRLLRLANAAASARGIDDAQRANLWFALGRVRDGLGEYDGAFNAFFEANRCARRLGPAYRREAMEAHVTLALQAAERPPRTQAAIDHPPLEPLFICGMFRSGSTLLEQVLHAHPRVVAGGEQAFFPRMALGRLAAAAAGQALDHATAASVARDYRHQLTRQVPADKAHAHYFTDKRPDNILLLGLIWQVFPYAKVVITRRHPLDTGLSVFQQHLSQQHAPYSSDLAEIGHYQAQVERLSAHYLSAHADRVRVFDYDAFVRAPEDVLRPLLSWLGLPWDPRCLAFHTQCNAVKTASFAQVRRPLYQASSGRWRNYQVWLEPMIEALRAAGVQC